MAQPNALARRPASYPPPSSPPHLRPDREVRVEVRNEATIGPGALAGCCCWAAVLLRHARCAAAGATRRAGGLQAGGQGGICDAADMPAGTL